MGLVDQLVDPASLEAVAVEAAASLASGSLKAKRKPKALMNKLIEDNPVGQSIMWKKVRVRCLFVCLCLYCSCRALHRQCCWPAADARTAAAGWAANNTGSVGCIVATVRSSIVRCTRCLAQ